MDLTGPPLQPAPARLSALVAAAGVAGLAAAAALGQDPGVLLVGTVVSATAALKVLAWRPWAAWPAVTPRQALGFAGTLVAAWGTILLAPAHVHTALPAQVLATVFSLALWLAASDGPDPVRAGAPHGAAWIPALLAAILFYPVVLALRGWVLRNFGYDASNSLHLFYMARVGYEGIPSAPFQDPWVLVWPALWWAATLACAAWAWQEPSLPRAGALAAAGFVGKFALAAVSATGLEVLPQKILAVSTSYYTLAAFMNHLGVWRFLTIFNKIQPNLSTHGVSHPFGPELFYWMVARGIDPSPWVPAVVIAALTALTPLLLRRLALELGASPRAALAAAFLYLAGPAAGILSTSGIDSLVTLVFLAAALAALWCVRDGRRGWGVAAGALCFVASLLTLATAYLLLLLGLAAVEYGLRRPRRDWPSLAGRAVLPLAVLLLLHLALWAGLRGSFSYLQVYAVAAPYQYFDGNRPLYLWSWLNPLLYLGFAGLGTLALAAAAAAAWLLEGRRPPRAALLTAVVLAALWLQGLGLGECQRMFHWGYAGLCLALSTPLARWEGRRGFAALAALATLNAAAATGLMVWAMDFW